MNLLIQDDDDDDKTWTSRVSLSQCERAQVCGLELLHQTESSTTVNNNETILELM